MRMGENQLAQCGGLRDTPLRGCGAPYLYLQAFMCTGVRQPCQVQTGEPNTSVFGSLARFTPKLMLPVEPKPTLAYS